MLFLATVSSVLAAAGVLAGSSHDHGVHGPRNHNELAHHHVERNNTIAERGYQRACFSFLPPYLGTFPDILLCSFPDTGQRATWWS